MSRLAPNYTVRHCKVKYSNYLVLTASGAPLSFTHLCTLDSLIQAWRDQHVFITNNILKYYCRLSILVAYMFTWNDDKKINSSLSKPAIHEIILSTDLSQVVLVWNCYILLSIDDITITTNEQLAAGLCHILNIPYLRQQSTSKCWSLLMFLKD